MKKQTDTFLSDSNRNTQATSSLLILDPAAPLKRNENIRYRRKEQRTTTHASIPSPHPQSFKTNFPHIPHPQTITQPPSNRKQYFISTSNTVQYSTSDLLPGFHSRKGLRALPRKSHGTKPIPRLLSRAYGKGNNVLRILFAFTAQAQKWSL